MLSSPRSAGASDRRARRLHRRVRAATRRRSRRVGYGDYEGLTSAQIHETAPGWDIFTGPTPGGETHDQVTARLDRVVAEIAGLAASTAPSASATGTRSAP